MGWLKVFTTSNCFTGSKMTKEAWKSIRGYKDYYEVSDLGRVRSLDRVVPNPRWGFQKCKGRIKSLTPGSGGYLVVTLSKYGKDTVCMVHRLVLSAFKGKCPPGKQCCHNDGDRENNCVKNLRWDTSRNNHFDKLNHGTFQRGEMHGNALLTEKKVIEILSLLDMGRRPLDIADKFNISPCTVSDIKRNKSWKHVKRNKLHPRIKNKSFTSKQVNEIISLLTAGESVITVALKFNVTNRVIHRLRRGKTYRNITGL